MKKYIKPAIIAKKVYFCNHLMQTTSGFLTTNSNGNIIVTLSDEEYDGLFRTKQYKIDLWADEVERDMAYGH